MKIPVAYLTKLNAMDKPALIAEILRLHKIVREIRQPPPGPYRCDICGQPTHAKGQLTSTLYFPCCCSCCLDLGLMEPVSLDKMSKNEIDSKCVLWGRPPTDTSGVRR